VAADLPYLDAFIEEVHRCALVRHVVIRKAIVDTQVLGYPIPVGPDVFFVSTTKLQVPLRGTLLICTQLNSGPDYLAPPMEVDESRCSKSSQEDSSWVGSWDPADIGAFKPELWLVTSP
jgi:hypothetical protein